MEQLEEKARQAICTEIEPLYFSPGSTECQEGSRLVFGKGPSDAQIVFVGSHPGKNENETGEPFTGKAGKNLQKLCKMFDIDLSTIYVTNVLKLALFGHHQQPSNDDIIRHARWLERQLQFIQPRLVVALGNVASKTLLHLFKHHNLDMTSSDEQDLQIKRINGHVHDLGFSYTVITTFNPIMYSDQVYQKPLEMGFKAINYEMRKARVSLGELFDIKPVVKAISVASSSSSKSAKTRDEILKAIQDSHPDQDAQEVFDAILEFFKCLIDEDQSEESQETLTVKTVQEVATSFDLDESIVQDIAVFQSLQKLQPSRLSRKRSASPLLDESSSKRSKALSND